MTTSREEAFAEVVALRVKNRSLQSRQWRIERLIKAIPDRQKTLEDGIWASTDGLNGAKREKEIRSEEHTSELQSLMRISYAVFCLKTKKLQKKKQKPQDTIE